MKFAYLGAAVAAAVVAVAAPACAETYAGLTAGGLKMALDTPPVDDASLLTAGGRIGWRPNKWIGVEGDLFFGVKEDKIYKNPDIGVKVDSAAFIYGVSFIPVTDKFELIARAGYGHLAAKISGVGGSEDTNDSAISYGAGAQYKWDKANGVRLDVTHYVIEQVPTNALTVAYVRTF
jgi:hypothetical protein